MNTPINYLNPPANFRWLWLASVVAIACLLGYGYHLQYNQGLEPCPLCMTQRFFYYCFAVFAVLGVLTFKSWGMQRAMAFFALLSAAGGLITAGRQVWLQHLPEDQVPACGPGLTFWLEHMPWMKTLELLFKGDGNCAEVKWSFLGLSIAEWSLAWFVLFALIALRILFARKRAA